MVSDCLKFSGETLNITPKGVKAIVSIAMLGPSMLFYPRPIKLLSLSHDYEHEQPITAVFQLVSKLGARIPYINYIHFPDLQMTILQYPYRENY